MAYDRVCLCMCLKDKRKIKRKGNGWVKGVVGEWVDSVIQVEESC